MSYTACKAANNLQYDIKVWRYYNDIVADDVHLQIDQSIVSGSPICTYLTGEYMILCMYISV